jgi:hypothetical protein
MEPMLHGCPLRTACPVRAPLGRKRLPLRDPHAVREEPTTRHAVHFLLRGQDSDADQPCDPCPTILLLGGRYLDRLPGFDPNSSSRRFRRRERSPGTFTRAYRMALTSSLSREHRPVAHTALRSRRGVVANCRRTRPRCGATRRSCNGDSDYSTVRYRVVPRSIKVPGRRMILGFADGRCMSLRATSTVISTISVVGWRNVVNE